MEGDVVVTPVGGSTSSSPGSSAPIAESLYSGCGETKGCLGIPQGCEGTADCQAMVTYKPAAGSKVRIGDTFCFNA